jgi:SNF2 family DNA or RNA helicase
VVNQINCLENDLKKSIEISYRGEGRSIAQQFYIPVLKRTKSYDRISGYFSVESLVITAAGLAGLIRNDGKMRLIVGVHDISEDMRLAYEWSKKTNSAQLEEITQQLTENLDNIEDVFSKKRLQAVAWMLKNDKLEIKVAMPKRTVLGLGNGIFHEKTLLFKDSDNCKIEASGSANETMKAYSENGENLTIHMSWKPGAEEYITRATDNFEVLWQNNHPEYSVYDLPVALSSKLKEKYYPKTKPEFDPEEDPTTSRSTHIELCNNLLPAAKLIREAGKIRSLSHLGYGPVMLYPHQAHAVNETLNHFPHRILLADEVGLGKTLEGGAIIKRLYESGVVKRIVILTPKNVTKQWLDELYTHFALKFWMLESNPKRLISAHGDEMLLGDKNPFDRPGIDHVIVSWHYARGSSVKTSELLTSKSFFDLAVIDEAHAARKKRDITGTVTPTKLNELCQHLSMTSPHILMLTATPVQLNDLEALDLLSILGLGGPWADESNFQRFYTILGNESKNVQLDDWLFAFRLSSWIAMNYLSGNQIQEILKRVANDEIANKIFYAIKSPHSLTIIEEVMNENPDTLRRILIAFSPMRVFMVRNTRAALEKIGLKFAKRIVKEEAVELSNNEKNLLQRLDEYLIIDYGKYEKIISQKNRGSLGFIKTVYHQRFVSSFTAAYLSIKRRKDFLEALLRKDEGVIREYAEKIFDEEEFEEDEEEFIKTMKELVDEARPIVLREVKALSKLENDLLPYSPYQQTSNDPKMQRVVKVVSEFTSKQKKVIVFSKYTDTVEAIKKMLLNSSGLQKIEVGTFTGKGGEIFDEDKNKWKTITKSEISRALSNKELKVLVCSDAASEGLNLQAANVIINADMPWNPARVEQRIGRVDRLGQKEDTVHVRNVWYPDSIEAKIYKKLFERKEIYHMVVGPAQQIISKTLREVLDQDSQGVKIENIVADVIHKVDEGIAAAKKNEDAKQGISLEKNTIEEDIEVIVRLEKFVKIASEALGFDFQKDEQEKRIKILSESLPEDLEKWNNFRVEAGELNTLTLGHPILIYLTDLIEMKSTNINKKFSKSCHIIKEHDGLGDLVIINKESKSAFIADKKTIVKTLDELLEMI